jgi:hypothetical protein
LRTTSLLRNKAIRASLVLGASAALLFTGGAVNAALTGTSGSYAERNLNRTQNVTYTNTSAANTWQVVPGMSHVVTVASGTTRVIEASYSARSYCAGGTGYCSVRIVFVKSGSAAITELNPVLGFNSIFDSADTDRYESNALNRSTGYLGAGTYTVRVEAAEWGTVGTFQLVGQHFGVDVVRVP